MSFAKNMKKILALFLCFILTSLGLSSASLTMASSSSAYSIWKESYGTSYYGIKSGSSTTTVSVSGAVRVGVDVSKYQEDIDWDAVADAGIDFAIIRCGYGMNYESQDDAYFIQNVKGALSAGLEIGVYLYSYASNTTRAASEAEHVLRLLDEAGLDPDDLSFPVFLDMEDDIQASLSASKRGDIAETFCDALEDEGYEVGIYANKSWWSNYLTDSFFSSDGLYRWVARYPTSSSVTSSGVSNTSIWQFTCHGTVDGIDGNVDVNFDYEGEGGYGDSISVGTVSLSSASLSSDLSSVTLEWTSVSNADGYQVYRSTDGAGYSKIKTTSSTSYSDTSIYAGSSYSYKVRAYAYNSDGTIYYGSFSSVKSVSVSLGTPSISSASSAQTGGIALSWTSVNGADGYEIYRSTDKESYTSLSSVSGTSYTDSSAGFGSVYSYKVRAYAYDSSGSKVYGSFSSAVSAEADLGIVELESVISNSNGTITLNWSEVEGAEGYQVYRSKNGGSYYRVSTRTSNTFTNTTVTAGCTYSYKVRAYAYDSNGDKVYSDYSNIISITAVPEEIEITSAEWTSEGAALSWEEAEGADGYEIYRSADGGDYESLCDVSGEGYTDASIEFGSVYSYKVRAYVYDSDGEKVYGEFSDAVSVEIELDEPELESVTLNSDGTITLSWSEVEGAEGYQIYRSKNGGSYYRVSTRTSNTFTNTTVTAGCTYSYKVRAYTYDSNGDKVYSEYSNIISITAVPEETESPRFCL